MAPVDPSAGYSVRDLQTSDDVGLEVLITEAMEYKS